MPRFTSQTQAMNQRRQSWLCLKCNHEMRRKAKLCEVCHSGEVHYFPSRKELRRYQQLRLMLKMGAITDLVLQPEFPITVNGHLICHYRADFQYREDGNLITEDTKGTETDLFRLKRKLVYAVHGVSITTT